MNVVSSFIVQSLKENNEGPMIIPCFNGKNKIFIAKKSIPVYPVVEEKREYFFCRGLIPELLNTCEIFACTSNKLKKEINEIKKANISRSLGFLKAYNSCTKTTFIRELINLSYTSISEMKIERKRYLFKKYRKISRNLEMKTVAETFLARLFGEIASPLIKENPNHWSNENLLAFFLGCPGKKYASIRKIKNSFSNYYRKIRNIRDLTDKEYVNSIIKAVLKNPDILLKLEIGNKEKIILSSCLIDLVEPFYVNRSLFYDLNEKIFEKLFPIEYKLASNKLKNLVEKFGGSNNLHLFVKTLGKDLGKLNYGILGAQFRLRRPAGLFQHHLMKKVPLSKVDDLMSIQVFYKNKSKTKIIVGEIDSYVKSKFKNSLRKRLRIGGYKGYHFYFNYKNVPFEIMVRDLRSNLSMENKIKHSINQKKYYRFLIK